MNPSLDKLTYTQKQELVSELVWRLQNFRFITLTKDLNKRYGDEAYLHVVESFVPNIFPGDTRDWYEAVERVLGLSKGGKQ